MLKITFSEQSLFNESIEEFINLPEKEFSFEHSLISIARWESIYEKPFLTKDKKEADETLEYIKCMCTDPTFETERLTEDVVGLFVKYIEKGHTATRVKSEPGSGQNRIMTSEVIYGYMASHRIPFHTDKWNINRLLTLIQVANDLAGNKKKKSTKDILKENNVINEARKAEMNTRG